MIKVVKKRDLLNEVLGVPDNITETAVMIYDKVMTVIPDNYDFDDLNRLTDVKIDINSDLAINEYKFNNFILKFNVEEAREGIHLISFGSGNPTEMTKNGYMSRSLLKYSNVGFALRIIIAAKRNIRGIDIKNFFNSQKEYIIGVLAHELMHTYDYYKQEKKSLKRELLYHLSSSIAGGGTGLKGIDNFFNTLYMGSLIETVVRSAEIGTELKLKKIDRKSFLKFMSSHSTINNLKIASQYTFNRFITELKQELPKILKIMKNSNISLPSDIFDYDESKQKEIIVFKFLKLYWSSLVQQGVQKVSNMVVDISNHEEMMSLMLFNKSIYDDVIKDTVNKLFRLGNKGGFYKKFFADELKYANFMAKKNLRKLFKLYAMAKNTDDKKLPSAMDRMTNESNYIFFENKHLFPKTDFKDLLKPNIKTINKKDLYWKL
jgi:hypothetical protein